MPRHGPFTRSDRYMTAKEMHNADPDRRIGRIIAIVRTEVHAGFGIAQCRLLACPFLLVLWTDIRDESCAAAHGNTGTGLTGGLPLV